MRAHHRYLLFPARYPVNLLSLLVGQLVPRGLISLQSFLLLIFLPPLVEEPLPPIYLKCAQASLARPPCYVGLLRCEYSGGCAALGPAKLAFQSYGVVDPEGLDGPSLA